MGHRNTALKTIEAIKVERAKVGKLEAELAIMNVLVDAIKT